MNDVRTYDHLISLPTLEERYNYLRVNSKVGIDKFGFDRYLNQRFYHSTEWKRVRDFIIVRDNGLELATPGFEINGKIYIHHMNPVSIDDLKDDIEKILNPDFLISCSFDMHQMIHYGEFRDKYKAPVERKPNDTCPWKR